MPPLQQTEAQRQATFAAAGMQPLPTLTAAPQPLTPMPMATSPLAAPDPRALAAQVNAESAQIFEATKGRDVDLRQSETIIRDLATKLAAPAPVTPPSLSQMFSTERQKLGLEPLEAELAALDSEIERTQVGAFTDADRVDDRAIGNTGRALRQGAISKEAERKNALLAVERSAIARQIDNKMSALQMTMQFTQQDYANASASYNAEFNRNMQMMDLFTGLQDREDAKQDKLAENARANLQTVTNLVKESGKSFADMDDDQLRNIQQWELQAGLPQGTYQTFGSAMPQAKILHTATSNDAAGNQIVTFIYDDGTGKPGTMDIVKTGGQLKVTGGSGGPSDGTVGIYDEFDYRTANAILSQKSKFDTQPIVKKYNGLVEARDAINGVASDTTNPADHQAIVYYFAKALDPESAVREGEYATIKKYAQNVTSRYAGEIKNAVNGSGFLSAGAIEDIKTTITQRVESAKPQYLNVYNSTSQTIDQVAGKAGTGSRYLTDYAIDAAAPDDSQLKKEFKEYQQPVTSQPTASSSGLSGFANTIRSFLFGS